MIHAFLITAYRDASALEELVAQLVRVRDSRIYINIDRRNTDLARRMQEFLAARPLTRIHVQSNVRVRWGSFQHLDAFMNLAQRALQDGCEYFHTMTGQCRIVRPIQELETFFSEAAGKSFLEHFPLPTEKWPGGGLDRIRYLQLYDVFDAKRNPLFRLNGPLLRLQKTLGVDRIDPGTQYFGGSTYYSISKSALIHLSGAYREQSKRFHHTLCAEEIVPHTILCNAPAHIRDNLVNRNLRFVVWREKHGEFPGILDADDFAAIHASECFFARKFDSSVSSDLARGLNGDAIPSPRS